MKKQIFLTIAFLILVAFTLPVLATGNGASSSTPAQQKSQQPQKGKQLTLEEEAALSNVPLTQLKLMKKREEAKKRRDELLKLRQQNIDAMNMGAAPVTTVPQPSGN